MKRGGKERGRRIDGLLREVLGCSRRTQGATHPDTLTCTYNLGRLLFDLGKRDEAEPLLREAAAGEE